MEWKLERMEMRVFFTEYVKNDVEDVEDTDIGII